MKHKWLAVAIAAQLIAGLSGIGTGPGITTTVLDCLEDPAAAAPAGARPDDGPTARLNCILAADGAPGSGGQAPHGAGGEGGAGAQGADGAGTPGSDGTSTAGAG